MVVFSELASPMRRCTRRAATYFAPLMALLLLAAPAPANDEPLDRPLPTMPTANRHVAVEEWQQFPSTRDLGNSCCGAARLSMLKARPGAADELWVNDLRGPLYRVVDGVRHDYFSLFDEREDFIHQPGLGTGFQAFAIHPEFNENGKFYTTHNEALVAGQPAPDFPIPDGTEPMMIGVVTEWTADDPDAMSFSGASRELMRIEMLAQMHGLQEIAFNLHAVPGDADYGNLYICLGDTSAFHRERPDLLQRLDFIYGTIMRIDPMGTDGENGQYGIPADNPWVDDADSDTRPEIFALGFRNPHRLAFEPTRPDGSPGRIFVTNIGEENIEDVSSLRPGENYGWPHREGTFKVIADDISRRDYIYPLPENDEEYGFTYPVIQYIRDPDDDPFGGNRARAVGSGIFYDGRELPYFRDHFIMNDIPGGQLLFVPLDAADEDDPAIPSRFIVRTAVSGDARNPGVTTFHEMYNGSRVDMRMGTDADGEIYLLAKNDGRAFRVRADPVHPWRNYTVTRTGWVETEHLGRVFIESSPWVYVEKLGNWAFWPIDELPVDEASGAWTWVSNPNPGSGAE